MPLTTTVIGSYPKPGYLEVPDWFKDPDAYIKYFSSFTEKQTSEKDEFLQKAMKYVLSLQESIGIDIITDGEVRRESYVHYFCRHLRGIDFKNLCKVKMRGGAMICELPSITGELSAKEVGWMAREWKEAQNLTEKPVKATLPGPMTIIDSTADLYYSDNNNLSSRLATLINREIQLLASAGCKYIQVDAPVLVRFPDEALSYGIDQLAACFKGVPDDVTKLIHICCGYPCYLDQEDYKKADPDAYLRLADKLDSAGFDQISLEDAHRHNDLRLFSHFKKTKIILGVVKIASSKVESVEEIKQRLAQVLTVIPAERLLVAPDCGLGYLPDELAQQKLKNLVTAAQSF